MEFVYLFHFLNFLPAQVRYTTYAKTHNLPAKKRLFFSYLIASFEMCSVAYLISQVFISDLC